MYFEITKKKKETTLSPVVSFFGLDQSACATIAVFERCLSFHFAEVDTNLESFRECRIVAHASFIDFNDCATVRTIDVDVKHVIDLFRDSFFHFFTLETMIRNGYVNRRIVSCEVILETAIDTNVDSHD